MQSEVRLVPAQCVRQRVSFLFQAELSIDRCEDVQQLRTYYARLWPDGSVEDLLARWSDETVRCKCSAVNTGMSRIRTLVQWFIFRRVYLSLSQIEESESSVRAFLSLIRGKDTPTKEFMISMRMRLGDAATSLCYGLPLSCLQSFRKVEHINAAPQLLLRSFSAESCGLRIRGCRMEEGEVNRDRVMVPR